MRRREPIHKMICTEIREKASQGPIIRLAVLAAG